MTRRWHCSHSLKIARCYIFDYLYIFGYLNFEPICETHTMLQSTGIHEKHPHKNYTCTAVFLLVLDIK
jgi:hypothetical protein